MDKVLSAAMVLSGFGFIVGWVVWMLRVATKPTPWKIRQMEIKAQKDWYAQSRRRGRR